jgi:CBS domain-containing protein
VTKEGSDARTLGDLLSERRIILPLRAETLTQALDVLASAAVADGLADRDRLDQELETLADHDLIPIGSHAVMAHMRTEAAHDLAMMMGVAEGALPFAPATAPEARTLVLVISPLSGGSRYLQTMAALARALGRRRVAERLDSADTAAEIMELDALREPVLGEEILVRDVMTPNFVSVRSDAPMAEVAEILIRRRLRAIPVVGDDGEVIGMVTDADIMEMFLPRIRGEEGVGSGEEDPGAGEEDPGARSVRDVMQRSVFSARADETVEAVADRMIRKEIERLPVVEEGRLVGFLTRGDIIRRLLRGHLRAR